MAKRGPAALDQARPAWQSVALTGLAGHGRHGIARHGLAWPSEEGQGAAGMAELGAPKAWRGRAQHGRQG